MNLFFVRQSKPSRRWVSWVSWADDEPMGYVTGLQRFTNPLFCWRDFFSIMETSVDFLCNGRHDSPILYPSLTLSQIWRRRKQESILDKSQQGDFPSSTSNILLAKSWLFLSLMIDVMIDNHGRMLNIKVEFCTSTLIVNRHTYI